MYIRKRGELTVFVKQFGGWENISLKLRDSLQTKRKQNFFAHITLQVGVHRRHLDEGARQLWGLWFDRPKGAGRLLHWIQKSPMVTRIIDFFIFSHWIFFAGWSCIFLCTLSFPQGPWKRESERGLVWGSGRLNAEAEIRASLCITLYYPPIVKYVQHLHQEYKS